MIGQAIGAIIPASVTVSFFVFLRLLLEKSGFDNLRSVMEYLVQFMFYNIQYDLGAGLLYALLIHVFWFFGVHGNVLVNSAIRDIYGTAQGKIFVAQGLAGGADNSIFSGAFFNHFAIIGGAGATLCLIGALLVVSKRGNIKRLARLSLVPGIFNINELLLFGLPIVLNPVYLIPFLLTPMAGLVLAHLAMAFGLVPLPVHPATWSTPVFLSGYIVTDSWKGIVLQGVNLLVGVLIYYPFVRLAEQRKELEIQKNFEAFVKAVIGTGSAENFLKRRDSLGNLARILSHDLKVALKKGEFYLEYQPQVHANGEVIGVEALLRWNHSLYGRIPPPVIVAIAEETAQIKSLGDWVIHQACRQLADWKAGGLQRFRLSINLSVRQLEEPYLAETVAEALAINQLKPEEVELEITENIALANDKRTLGTLSQLHSLGVRIAIDDFGMGHSSIRYIKYFPVQTLKIDRSLSVDIVKDKNCQEIVASIASLCSSLEIDIIAEYVETEAQRKRLGELGCLQYQGYLYSPPLPAEKVLDYVRDFHYKSSSQ